MRARLRQPGDSVGGDAPATNYLVQVSFDLQTWSYLPATNPSGEGAPITVVVPFDAGSNTSPTKIFFRAVELDAAASPLTGNALPDAWEQFYFGTTEVNQNADPDSDGLTNLQEYRLGTNPCVADTDGDEMPDGWEYSNNLNPKATGDSAADPDRDGLSNHQEHLAGADPQKKDSDGDGLTDGLEVSLGSSVAEADAAAEIVFLPEFLPIPAGTVTSSASAINNSGVAVGYIDDSADMRPARWTDDGGSFGAGVEYFSPLAVNDAGASVGQMITDSAIGAMFWAAGAAPQRFGGWMDAEIAYDINNPGVVVGERSLIGISNAFVRSADGTLSGLETPAGYQFATPYAINDENTIVGTALQGQGGSILAPVAMSWIKGEANPLPSATEAAWDVNNAGEIAGRMRTGALFVFRSGVLHLLPALEDTTPDCTDLKINLSGVVLGNGGEGSLIWQPNGDGGWSPSSRLAERLVTNLPPALFRAVGLNDQCEMVGDFENDFGFYSAVRFRPILRPRLLVDANRDGAIRTDASDLTSQAAPFRFWSNDDDDGIYTDSIESEEDDLNVTDASKEDWRGNVIDSPRDLEDFARLHLYVGGLQEAFRNGDLYLGLKWSDTSGTNPTIKLYRATSPADNDTAYLAEENAANRQSLEAAIIDARYPAYSGGNFQSDHTQIGTSDFFVLPSEQTLLLPGQNPTLRFIFEGCTTGKGQLKLVILKKEGTTYTEISNGPGVWLDIKKPHEFIQRWTCGDGSLATVQPVQFDAAKSGTFATPTLDEEKDLVLFVHGYNMQADWEKQRWIETTFKRLYWLGYKGRVGGFVWPCVLDGPSQFNASEERAWQAGEQLKALLQQLKGQGYRVHVLGHSQGNVVVGEALRQAGPNSSLVSTYVASQAALAVHGYDASQPDRGGPIAFTPSTPNVYARYWTSLQDPNLPETWGSGSPSYFAQTYTQGAADKFVNFYNPQDYALTGNGLNPVASDGSQTGWLINQRLKPWIGYDYASYIGFRESPLTNFSPRLFRFPDDRFVIFSYGAQARSIALGAGASGGVFNGGNVNLFDAPTEYRGQHVFHSGQFRSNYASRWAYWRQLIISCDLAGRNAP